MTRGDTVKTKHHIAKFTPLMVALVILGALFPALAWRPWGMLIWFFAFWTVLLGALHAVHRRKRYLNAARVLAGLAVLTSAPAIYGYCTGWWHSPVWYTAFFLIVNLAFLTLITGATLMEVLSGRRVDLDRLLGSVSVYVLMGLTFAFLFMVVALLNPGALVEGGVATPSPNDEFAPYFHYSFSTLTTLGYGDIVPDSPLAQLFSSTEAIAGQVYLTVLVARLVGLHISQGPVASQE